MFTNKDKERVSSLTGNITAAAIIITVLAKDIFLRVEIPDTFSGNRKKFKAYETECRIYF
jgi:hypothetical protein